MNAHNRDVQLVVERGQAEEAVLSIFHTVLLHRTTGKFHYTAETSYSSGSVGTEDIDCDFVDFTFVRVSSKLLDVTIRKQVVAFCDQLQQHARNGISTGTITLEFYQKRQSYWPLNEGSVPWEIWNIFVTERAMPLESERNMARETTAVHLASKISTIVDYIGKHDFVPKTPNKTELPLVFDTTFEDVQPFLFRIYYSFGNATNISKVSAVGSTVRRFIRDMSSH